MLRLSVEEREGRSESPRPEFWADVVRIFRCSHSTIGWLNASSEILAASLDCICRIELRFWNPFYSHLKKSILTSVNVDRKRAATPKLAKRQLLLRYRTITSKCNICATVCDMERQRNPTPLNLQEIETFGSMRGRTLPVAVTTSFLHQRGAGVMLF